MWNRKPGERPRASDSLPPQFPRLSAVASGRLGGSRCEPLPPASLRASLPTGVGGGGRCFCEGNAGPCPPGPLTCESSKVRSASWDLRSRRATCASSSVPLWARLWLYLLLSSRATRRASSCSCQKEWWGLLETGPGVCSRGRRGICPGCAGGRWGVKGRNGSSTACTGQAFPTSRGRRGPRRRLAGGGPPWQALCCGRGGLPCFRPLSRRVR